MTRADRPLHIVGIPTSGHICPSGKCAQRSNGSVKPAKGPEAKRYVSDELDAPESPPMTEKHPSSPNPPTQETP